MQGKSTDERRSFLNRNKGSLKIGTIFCLYLLFNLFFHQITGYTWTADKSLIQLEHIVADLAGVCVRIMISPPVTAHKNLTQVMGLE